MRSTAYVFTSVAVVVRIEFREPCICQRHIATRALLLCSVYTYIMVEVCQVQAVLDT